MRHAKKTAAPGSDESPSRSDERRAQLVLATYHLIADEGFEGLRVRDVAERAGLNIATLHYYFPAKEDLVRGVVDYLLDQFLRVEAPRPPGGLPTPTGQLGYVFADLAYQLETAPEMFAVLTEMHLRARRDAPLRKMLRAMNDGWQTHIAAVCEAGVQSGDFDKRLDPARAASILTALIKGLSLQAISDLDPADPGALGAEVIRWLSRRPRG